MKTYLKIDFSIQAILIIGCLIGIFFPGYIDYFPNDEISDILLATFSWMIFSSIIAGLFSPRSPRFKLLIVFLLGCFITFLSAFLIGYYVIILGYIMMLVAAIITIMNLFLTYQTIQGKEPIKIPDWYNDTIDSDEILKINQ